MSSPLSRYGRSELRFACSALGWRGKKSTSKEELLAWVQSAGISPDKIATSVDNLRRVASGRPVTGQVGGTGMTSESVQKLIDDRVAEEWITQCVARLESNQYLTGQQAA